MAAFPDGAQTLGDERICIAVLDGPVDLAHPCFDGAKLTTTSAGLGGDFLNIRACEPSDLVIGAMDSGWGPMSSSKWGKVYRMQWIVALGEAVIGAVPGGGVAMITGTSFATPIVTGFAALLLSMQLE